jgi:hypothetical protein
MPKRDPQIDAHLEWIGFVRPPGLVVSAPALVRAGAFLPRDPEGQRRLRACVAERRFGPDGEPEPWLPDFPAFAGSVLGWSFSPKGYAGTEDSPITARAGDAAAGGRGGAAARLRGARGRAARGRAAVAAAGQGDRAGRRLRPRGRRGGSPGGVGARADGAADGGAGGRAVERPLVLIVTRHLEAVFEDYSQGRIQDSINEYRSEMPDIERLLVGMKPAKRTRRTRDAYLYDTGSLLEKLRNIMEGGRFRFATGQEAREKDLASFLYKTNFLIATKSLESRYIVRRYFEENRYLSSTFADFGFAWEVHPAYRWALQPDNVWDILKNFPPAADDDEEDEELAKERRSSGSSVGKGEATR